MKNVKTKFVIFAGLLAGSLTAFALQAGPYILNGKVSASNDKTVTLIVGDKEAEVPRKLLPTAMQNGKVETGTAVSLALSEEQSKTVKVRNK